MADFFQETLGKTVAAMDDREKMRYLSHEAKAVINLTINVVRRELNLDNGKTAQRQDVVAAAEKALETNNLSIANKKIMTMLAGAHRSYLSLSQRQWPTCAKCGQSLPYTTLIGTIYATICNNCKE